MTKYFSILTFIVLTSNALASAQDFKFKLRNYDSLSDCKCNSTLHLVPVCEDEEITYDEEEMTNCINKCSEKSDLTIVHTRECTKKKSSSIDNNKKQIGFNLLARPDPFDKECNCFVENIDFPVCGSDGTTYPHPNVLYCIRNCKKKDVRVLYPGVCKEGMSQITESEKPAEIATIPFHMLILRGCKCNFTREWNPVCDRNGITHDNPSILFCETACFEKDYKIKHWGVCRTEDNQNLSMNNPNDKSYGTCKCKAAREFSPVCGSDGLNYRNKGWLKCAKKCINKNLTIMSYDQCPDKDQASITTSIRKIRAADNIKYYEPEECSNCFETKESDILAACGTDGKTYAIKTLDCINKCKNTDVKIDYVGECIDSPSAPAPAAYASPVAVSFFSSDDCYNQHAFISPERYFYFKTNCEYCYKNRYPQNYLCGTDGLTYHNRDALRCFNFCTKTDVSVVHAGCCSKYNRKPCTCPKPNFNAPVCGSDRRTHANIYILDCENRCYNKNVQKLYDGPCNDYPLYVR